MEIDTSFRNVCINHKTHECTLVAGTTESCSSIDRSFPQSFRRDGITYDLNFTLSFH